MTKNTILFIVSLFIVLCTSFFCVFSLLSPRISPAVQYSSSSAIARPVYITPESTSNNVTPNQNVTENINPQKNNTHLHNITKKLIFTLLLVLLIPAVSALLIIKKFNLLYKNVSDSNGEIQSALNKLEELQQDFKNIYDLNQTDTETNNVVKELNELIENYSKEELENVEIKPVKRGVNKASSTMAKYVHKEKSYTSSQMHEPLLISEQPISKTKGFYLVDCGKDKALVGYINDEIFLLNKFQKLQNKNIQVRLTEKIGHKNIYIVKNGTYKALVQVEKEKMKVLLEM